MTTATPGEVSRTSRPRACSDGPRDHLPDVSRKPTAIPEFGLAIDWLRDAEDWRDHMKMVRWFARAAEV